MLREAIIVAAVVLTAGSANGQTVFAGGGLPGDAGDAEVAEGVALQALKPFDVGERPVAPGAATAAVAAPDPVWPRGTQSSVVTAQSASGVSGFTDDPLVPGMTAVRAVHFRELRTRIDALRTQAGLSAYAWTSPVLTPGVTLVRSVHLTELRTAMNEAYDAGGQPRPAYTDAAVRPGTTAIRAAHVTELRRAVVELEVEGGQRSGSRGDRRVLTLLYRAMNGSGWTDSTNWLTDAPLSTWFGVATDYNGRVTNLELTYNGLRGPLPDTLVDLSELESLDLSLNELDGSIPASLGRLSDLKRLSFQGNQLTGRIPRALGDLSELQSLNLDGNRLTGQIPTSLGRLSKLRLLWLSSNKLTGQIPRVLGDLPELGSLYLGGNWFTGRIPSSLGRLSNLWELQLSKNDLTGRIPPSLGRLSKLQFVYLSHNWRLSGLIPDWSSAPLRRLDAFVTQLCAPGSLRDWLTTLEYGWAVVPCEGVGRNATIDVAVFYTPAARERAGGVAAIEAAIDRMIFATNEAYLTSGVRHRLELVARSEVQYAESGESHVDLNRLIDPTDGYLDEVHALRTEVGADLVSLIVDWNKTNAAQAGESEAFSVVGYPDEGLTFAHELGHNAGLVHDRYESFQFSSGWAAHHPGYGYVNQRAFLADAAPSSRWQTIMSYGTQCYDAGFHCEALFRFSNPRLSHSRDPLGVPYGDGGRGLTGPADAAAVLNASGPGMAVWGDGLLEFGTAQAPLSHNLNEDPIAYGTTPIRVADLASLRSRIDGVRRGLGLARFVWTDPVLRWGVTPVDLVHVQELREALNAAYAAAGRVVPRWTDPVPAAGTIDLAELRTAVATLTSRRTMP